MEYMQFETDLCVQLDPYMSTPSPTTGGHYIDLDTPPPPNEDEDDHSDDCLGYMTVAPQVYYFVYLSCVNTTFWGMCFF